MSQPAKETSLKNLPAIAGLLVLSVVLFVWTGRWMPAIFGALEFHAAVPYSATDYSVEARPVRDVTSVRRAAIREPQ